MTETSTELEDLRSLYRTAFNEWAAERRPEAESKYRDVRNRLISAMGAASEELDQPVVADGPESFAGRRQKAVDELQRLSEKDSL